MPKVTHKLALYMCVALATSAWLFSAHIDPSIVYSISID